MQLMPYFMKNKAWYKYDDKLETWVLTDKAPPEAVKSYEEYYAEDDVRLVGFEELKKDPDAFFAKLDRALKGLPCDD